MTRDEATAAVAGQARKFRVAVAIASHEQLALADIVGRAERDETLTLAEIQMLLMAQGPRG